MLKPTTRGCSGWKKQATARRLFSLKGPSKAIQYDEGDTSSSSGGPHTTACQKGAQRIGNCVVILAETFLKNPLAATDGTQERPLDGSDWAQYTRGKRTSMAKKDLEELKSVLGLLSF